MIAASLYVMRCTARNRLRVRLRRLREPRYLLGAIAGAAYLYFSVFARVRTGRRARRRIGERSVTTAALQSMGATIAPLGAAVLLAVSAAAWLVPFESGLLQFSDAEIAFLFPAPVSRRQLLVHRVIRSQLGMLFSAVILAFVFPSGAGLARVRAAIAMWVLLFTGRLYFTGVTLTRMRMRSGAAADRRRAWAPAVLVFGATAATGLAIYRAWPRSGFESALEIVDRLAAALSQGATAVALAPFLAMVRPFFATSTAAFLSWLAASAAVAAVATWWVLASDAAFQEAAADIAGRREAAQATPGATPFKVRGAGVSLALTGRPELAFGWKGLMQTLRIVDRRSIARLLAIVGSLTIAAVSLGRANGLAAMLGVFATMGAGFTILIAPQALRADLRQDLLHLELLKTWPVGASAIVRGEMLWPAALLTMGAWVLLAVAFVLSATVFGTVAMLTRAAVAAAFALLAPALISAQYTIHNGITLMSPAWVPLGSARPRGLDAMGQRLILLGGTWLLLAAMALPGAIAGGVVWLGFRPWIGAAAFVFAALVAAAIVGVEVLIASEALGPLFERVDISAVERSE